MSRAEPQYPESARQKRIEGEVVLALVVGADGAAHDIQVSKSVGSGLDEAAIAAVTQWKFDPATYQGKPVPVRINVQIRFRLASSTINNSSPASPSTDLSDQTRNLIADAEEAYSRRDYQTAADLARRATSLASRSSAWNILGMSLRQLGQLDAAVTAFETQIQLDPASPVAYNNLGLTYWQQHKYDDAAAQFQKQILVNPQDRYAHANLGVMLRDQKKCTAAVAELKTALSLTPNNVRALLALGDCDLALGNTATGLSELEQATSASPASEVRNTAAYMLAERNLELDRAQKWAEMAISLDSTPLHGVALERLSPAQLALVNELASHWDTLGWVEFRQGKIESSEVYASAAWFLRPIPVKHLESTPYLYRKMLDAYFLQREDFKRTEDKDVTQDSITGTRWKFGWTEKGVAYLGITEFFSVGDDHYRISALAPAEVYSRYQEDLEDMVRSLQFPMLHTSAKELDKLK